MSASNFEKQRGKELSPNLITWSLKVPNTAPCYCLQVDYIYIYIHTHINLITWSVTVPNTALYYCLQVDYIYLSLNHKEKIYKTEYILLNHTLTKVQMPPYMWPQSYRALKTDIQRLVHVNNTTAEKKTSRNYELLMIKSHLTQKTWQGFCKYNENIHQETTLGKRQGCTRPYIQPHYNRPQSWQW